MYYQFALNFAPVLSLQIQVSFGVELLPDKTEKIF